MSKGLLLAQPLDKGVKFFGERFLERDSLLGNAD
jgi:hypothetical protein